MNNVFCIHGNKNKKQFRRKIQGLSYCNEIGRKLLYIIHDRKKLYIMSNDSDLIGKIITVNIVE